MELLFPIFGAGIESERDGEDKEAAETSVKTHILSQVARVVGWKKKPSEADKRKAAASSKSGRKSLSLDFSR